MRRFYPRTFLRKLRRQPRLTDGRKRDPILACIPEDLKALVIMDASFYGVFPSWIVADILAAHYGVDQPNAITDNRR